MSEVPRRKWLQVHLSTAVVLMFAAGGIIWANVVGQETVIASFRASNIFYARYNAHLFGWPFVAVIQFDVSDPHPDWQAAFPNYFSMVLDVSTALAILFAVWFVCERWIAWRAGRKKG